MDRRYKDYFIVTFKREHSYWRSGFLTDRFNHFPPPIKVHWRSIRNIPYALVSINKELSETAVSIFKNTYGVDRVIPYTEQKERDWDMWQKYCDCLRMTIGLSVKFKSVCNRIYS